MTLPFIEKATLEVQIDERYRHLDQHRFYVPAEAICQLVAEDGAQGAPAPPGSEQGDGISPPQISLETWRDY
jgi:hypothetical protein